MLRHAQHEPAERLLIVMPSWLGDVVMATPTLRALRLLYPEAHITALMRRSLKPILDACPWVDRIVTVRRRGNGKSADGKSPEKPGNEGTGIFGLARRLGGKKFDTAVLLSNSFRWALVARMANIPRRIGYDRDGRGGLLTDRLLPRRNNGQFIPVPTRGYYLGIARYLGAARPDPTMQLFTRPADEDQASQMLTRAGVRAGQPLVLINPGAYYGEAKRWDPARFAQVAERCVDMGAVAAVSGAPNERVLLDQVVKRANHPVINLSRLGVDLALLKSVVKRSSLMVTNDTGPRHIAAAFGVSVVTIFGPTDPAWTRIDFAGERQVMAEVYCRPCQKKKCPLQGTTDFHQCMNEVGADMVFKQVSELLERTLHPPKQVSADK